ncbi:plant intracellular Ras-group-related LRR protein 7-like [Pyrus ussuriensis x Pyrus communis]|uniref:Plant intracellular Ras-group-related LRR protein 7-like n=1 Tax=Pyrus ussuriensis x Pyrus communis TaxID=2448454 RepID=A0A5N5HJ48_9ROSA|nr:plant intracellular Ras-group-related LRR protein 7-like [Pyrus ussuriensis x Pyrus communis]
MQGLNMWRLTIILSGKKSSLKFTTKLVLCLISCVCVCSMLCIDWLLSLEQTFPAEVLDLDRSIRTIDLTNNKIVEIPMDISKLVNLQRLMLAHNLIDRLPINLAKLESLKVMTLDGNQVTTLPDEYFLMQLKLLNVSKNKLKSLPESIGSCFSLEELQADDDSIDELPESVCNLIHVKSFCLDNNNIPTNLLKDCKALQNISLHGNPISMDQFQQMEGFQEFEARRKKKFDKQIDSNVMISSKGLDEGVDL